MPERNVQEILVVGQDTVGIIDIILEGISTYTPYKYDYFNFELIWKQFKYRNIWHRIENFVSKNTTGVNFKKQFYDQQVINSINNLQPTYDMIFLIRPDLLHDHHLEMLRKKTKNMVAYYWDTMEFFPRKQAIIKYFDRIFSFEPSDCKKYGFEFIPNFYFFEASSAEIIYQVYNLSSIDSRQRVIESIARQLEEKNISYVFKGYDGRPFKNRYIQHTFLVPYKKMLEEMSHCEIVLDIQKPGQSGLTFRPFEALGLNKKLITTNSNIKEYDFYNPSNISILDIANPKLDTTIFQKKYLPIPEHIRSKYHLSNWIKQVFQF
jgi:hypothetical protein